MHWHSGGGRLAAALRCGGGGGGGGAGLGALGTMPGELMPRRWSTTLVFCWIVGDGRPSRVVGGREFFISWAFERFKATNNVVSVTPTMKHPPEMWLSEVTAVSHHEVSSRRLIPRR